MPAILWTLTGTGLAAWVGILAYAILNKSHHTGWEPYSALYGFAPLLLLGIFGILVHKRQPRLRLPGILLIVIGLLGALTIIYFDQSNQLVQYDRWVKRGMP